MEGASLKIAVSAKERHRSGESEVVAETSYRCVGPIPTDASAVRFGTTLLLRSGFYFSVGQAPRAKTECERLALRNWTPAGPTAALAAEWDRGPEKVPLPGLAALWKPNRRAPTRNRNPNKR